METAFATYEEQLSRDWSWAMSEGGRHFEEDNAVFKSLRRITRKLNELNIPYAVVGGMALFHHGFRRFTEDVDLLVTTEDLKKIHTLLEGRGWLPPFPNSKHLRDTATGVKIEFLTTGDFPGDGKPKPVFFPDPATVSEEANDIKFINLPTLMELKLASGMSNVTRAKDLGDAIALIQELGLTAEFAEQLNPYVRAKYAELWEASRLPGLSDTMPE
jgi:hypothetical protein